MRATFFFCFRTRRKIEFVCICVYRGTTEQLWCSGGVAWTYKYKCTGVISCLFRGKRTTARIASAKRKALPEPVQAESGRRNCLCCAVCAKLCSNWSVESDLCNVGWSVQRTETENDGTCPCPCDRGSLRPVAVACSGCSFGDLFRVMHFLLLLLHFTIPCPVIPRPSLSDP